MPGPIRKPFFIIAAALVAFACFPPPAARAGEVAPRSIARPNAELAALNGKRLGTLSGTVHDSVANRFYDYTQIEYFDDIQSLLQAVLDEEIDAAIIDDPVARVLVDEDPRFRKLAGSLQDDDYAFAVRPDERMLYSQVNSIMNDLVESGETIRLIQKWLESSPENRFMPPAPPAGTGDPLRFGVTTGMIPFVYRDADGRIIGMDIELAGIIASRLDRPLEVVDVPFSRLIRSLLDGKLDMIGTALSVNKERAGLIRFTRSYFRGGVSALVKAGKGATGEE